MEKFYLYVYLDPLNSGKFIYDGLDIFFDYEPIYVGKGKNSRMYYHIDSLDDKSVGIKFDKLKYILKESKISKIVYKQNFIIKIKESEDELEILKLEELFVNSIGTLKKVKGVKNRGPLTNLIPGGISNPILYGENNPMYGKSIYDVWESKFDDEIYKKLVETNKNLHRENSINRWKNMPIVKRDEISNKISNSIKNKGHYFKKLTEEQKIKLIEERNKKTKITRDNRSEEESKIIFEKISNSLKKYRNSLTEEEKLYFSEKLKNSLRYYYDNVFGEKERLKRSESIKSYWNDIKSDKEKYLEYLEKVSGENHYLSSYDNLESYLTEKYGKEKMEDMMSKRKLSFIGEKNPMYGKGHIISGSKNGRAEIFLVHFPDGTKYLCIGTFKKLCDEVLCKIKPQPHRKYKFDGVTRDGWMFTKINKNQIENLENLENYTKFY